MTVSALRISGSKDAPPGRFGADDGRHLLSAGLATARSRLLAGKKGEGMFAATYRVLGDYADPGVKVNPLSALAPGLLRNLVEILSNPIVGPKDSIMGEVPSSP